MLAQPGAGFNGVGQPRLRPRAGIDWQHLNRGKHMNPNPKLLIEIVSDVV